MGAGLARTVAVGPGPAPFSFLGPPRAGGPRGSPTGTSTCRASPGANFRYSRCSTPPLPRLRGRCTLVVPGAELVCAAPISIEVSVPARLPSRPTPPAFSRLVRDRRFVNSITRCARGPVTPWDRARNRGETDVRATGPTRRSQPLEDHRRPVDGRGARVVFAPICATSCTRTGPTAPGRWSAAGPRPSPTAAAGVILAGTFASPRMAGIDMMTRMGFAVSVGICVSAFVVSMFRVPSVTALIGHTAWWPGHADRAPKPAGRGDEDREPVFTGDR
ncbi:MMPL family transporter [Embleya sp. NPDC050154]|uniref:MMPL family transporter n=1 Tax=Embleya sp. NPDC050154 TaxID=3363988 RepID=UPI0037A2E0E6